MGEGVHVHTYVCVHVHMFTCLFKATFAGLSNSYVIKMCVYVCVCVCVYICVCVWVCVCPWTFKKRIPKALNSNIVNFSFSALLSLIFLVLVKI